MKTLTTSTVQTFVASTITVICGNPGDSKGSSIVQARVLSIHDNGFSQTVTAGNSEGFMYHVSQLEGYSDLYYCTSGFTWDEKWLANIERFIGVAATSWADFDWSDYKVLASGIRSEELLDQFLLLREA